MTKVELLENLCAALKTETKDLLMPVALQKGDTEQIYRCPDIHKMRLPNSMEPYKKVPYILVRVISGKDEQSEGSRPVSKAVVRMTFAVYEKDEAAGEMLLLNLMERVRIGLEKRIVIGGIFELDLTEGVQTDIYDGMKAPYYAGEMISVWKMPAIQREDIRECL